MKDLQNFLNSRKRPFKIEWTEEEDNILFSYNNESMKNSWKTISDILKNKTPSQCFYRFHNKNKKSIKKNWTISEDKFIKEYVNIYGKKWDEIAQNLNLRTAKQIKDRYKNKLDDNLTKAKFNSKEDEIILNLFLKFGSKWSLISKELAGRTADMIKGRFYSCLKKKIVRNSEYQNLNEYDEKVNKFFSFSFEYLIFLFSIFKKKFFSYFK